MPIQPLGLLGLALVTTACIGADTPAPQHADDHHPSAAALARAEPGPAARTATVHTAEADAPTAGPPTTDPRTTDASCPAFRDPDVDAKTRRGRIAFLRRRTAVMQAGDPALGESLLWLAELTLLGGDPDAACEALERLTAESSPGDALQTATCWHEQHCVSSSVVSCPEGYTQHDWLGCQPANDCELMDTDIEAQVAGACERGDAACCPMEGKVHQVRLHRARKSGDDPEQERQRLAVTKAYERACDLGHASLCALVAEQLEESAAQGDAGASQRTKAAALSARACTLGHRASCP